MLQQIIVILIGIAVVLYLLKKLFKCFGEKDGDKNRCDDCPGCILHPKKKD
jgi:uncharacterized membrane protein YuzA (DUF378 family)